MGYELYNTLVKQPQRLCTEILLRRMGLPIINNRQLTVRESNYYDISNLYNNSSGNTNQIEE